MTLLIIEDEITRTDATYPPLANIFLILRSLVLLTPLLLRRSGFSSNPAPDIILMDVELSDGLL